MASLDKRFHRLIGGSKIVHRKRIRAKKRYSPIQKNDGAIHIPCTGKVLDVDTRGWRNDHPIDPFGQQSANCITFEFDIFVCRGEKHNEAVYGGNVRNGANCPGKMKTLCIWNNEADRLAATSRDTTGKLVRSIG